MFEIQEETKVTRFIECDGIRFYSDGKSYWQTSRHKRLHVYVWEKHNGKVPDGYHVHHIDGDKTNNDISNLQLLSQSEHMRYHNNTDEMKKMFRKNLAKYARPKAIEWHKSEASTDFHKELYKKSLGKYVGVKEKKKCTFCGKEFEYPVSRPLTKFCSTKCKSASRAKSHIDDIEKICVICGNKFMGNKNNGVKTCSHECRYILSNKTKEEKYGKSKGCVPRRD